MIGLFVKLSHRECRVVYLKRAQITKHDSNHQSVRGPAMSAVIFDFDGTLTAPYGIDFVAMRQAIGCPPDHTILEYIVGLPPEQRAIADARVYEMELESARTSQPNRDAEAVVRALLDRGVTVAILTRNCREAVDLAFANFADIGVAEFAAVVCRDSGFPPKPAPDAIFHIADVIGVLAQELWMVGDYVFDLDAGRAAGARTVYLCNDERPRWQADFVIANLQELPALLTL